MILLSDYYLRNYTKMNEADVGDQQQGDNQDNSEPEDFTAQPVDPTGKDDNNQGDGNDNPADTDNNDAPSADDQGDNDSGGGEDPEDFTQDEGGGGGNEPEDFTGGDSGGGDDMGGDDSSSSDSGDTGGGSSGEEVEQTADDARAIEKDIFDNLTPSQIDVKHRELKNNFIKLFDATSNTITRINDIPTNEKHRSVLSFVNKQLSDLRDLITDYMENIYSTKSYMENAINYNKFLAHLDGVNKILNAIAEDLDKNKEENN